MTRKLSMLSRVSSLAVAAALTASAAAQSLLGDPTITFGSVNIIGGPGTTDVSIFSPTAVIDWTPNDNLVGNFGAIAFQNSGTTATYRSATDFAVLNRINVADNSRRIFMNGTINGFINQNVGGNIFFYSPSGFIIGSSARINVGALVLSASPIAVDGNGGFISNGTVVFGQAPHPGASINTVAGSSISALNEGSYVAMIAPRVEHRGNIAVNGAAALVGAEAATITFRPSGLFDIQVNVGTTNLNGVQIDGGTISGPASSGAGDNHRIYAVAVPKNNAMTMIISNGASLGFDVAQAADVVGNAVILSSGHDIQFGQTSLAPSAANGGAANIGVSNSAFTSAVFAEANGFANFFTAFQPMSFASDLSIHALGNVNVSAGGSGGTFTIAGDLSMSTDVRGTNNGSSVVASQAALYTLNGGTLNIAGDVNISADGFGAGSSTAGVAAGNGRGGQVRVQAETNSSLSIGGNLFATAEGFGGAPNASGINAGRGDGGTVFIGTIGENASLSVTGTAYASANGNGGDGGGLFLDCSGCNGLGGVGQGGSVQVTRSSSTTSTAYFGNSVELHADGYGGVSGLPGSASATGLGGGVIVNSIGTGPVEGFGLEIAGNLDVTAIGEGGISFTPGIASGLGNGGFTNIYSFGGGSMMIRGALDADASGLGGLLDSGVDGGDGIGGTVNLSASGGNSFVGIAGPAVLRAEGLAGSPIECLGCGAVGGDGIGGSVNIFGSGGTGNRIDFGATLDMFAEGYGGDGVTGAGGLGDGGNAQISVTAGLTINVASTLVMEADGIGGYAYNANTGGRGVGGQATIFANGGSLNALGNVFLDAGGLGGGSGIVTGGTGGNGEGGIAQVYAPAGSIDIIGSLFMDAVGEGGDTLGGTGGNGLGGRTILASDGGSIRVRTNLFMDSGAIGGNGATGGSATALVSPPVDELSPVAVAIVTGAGGTITVDGTAAVTAGAIGGNGSNGNGGNATAGEVDVVAYFGNISLGTLALDATAFGGSGGNGGLGGNALGGVVDVAFGFGAAAVGGSITLGTAIIAADGNGGEGGAGIGANSGGAGGAGGEGTGGSILFVGSAGGGTLNSGTATLSALGTGGNGGNGGNGDSGSGGNGGAGGIGQGGFIQTGTVSAELAPSVGGGANYTDLFIATNGQGGAGGAGGIGGGGTGLGGAGGDAFGGRSLFLARGVLVTADTVALLANASGGDGGTGSTDGAGGDATTGFIAVESKDRFGHPDQRGTLEAGSIFGVASAIGGTGSTNGASIVRGGSYFRVLNGDATIGSVSLSIAGDVYDPSFVNSFVSVRDGTANIGDFSFTTTGDLALDASNGSMNATTIDLAAGTFRVDNANPAQAGPGTYSATTFNISTGGDFITNANLVSTNSINLVAPGLIAIENVTSGGTVFGSAGTDFSAGDFDAADGIEILALGNIVLGNLTAGVAIAGFTDTAIELDAGGSILIGNATALGAIDFTAGTTVTGGNLTSGLDIGGDAQGAISLGNLSAGLVNPQGPSADGFSIGIASATSIVVGNAAGAEAVGFATLGPLTTGNINAGTDVLAMVSGNMSFGSITAGPAGRTYLADASMFIAAGGVNNFNPNLVFPFAPVPTSGSITITGPVSTGSFQAAAGTNFGAGNITATNGIEIVAGGNIVLANLLAGKSTFAFNPNAVSLDANGSILMGNATALGIIDFSAGTTMTGGNLTSGVKIGGDAGGAILLGNLSGGLINPQGPSDDGFSVGIGSGTSIAVGTVSGAESVGLFTPGPLTTGNISAGADLLALIGGNLSVGSITAGAAGRTYLAGYAMVAAAGGPDNFDPALVYAAAPVPTSGSITIAGPVSTGSFQAAAGTSFGGGAITAGTTIFIRSGGSTTTGNLGAGTNVNIASSGGAIATGSINANSGILLRALGGITTGAMTSGGFIDARGGGSILTGNLITTSGDIFLASDANIATGTVTAATDAGFDSLGNVTLGVANVGGLLFVDAGGNLALASAQAGTFIDLLAGGTLNGGNLTAGQSILARSNGALALGNLSAGIVNPSGSAGTRVVGIGSNTSVQVGNVNGADFVGLTSAGALTAGAVQSGGDFMALVNGPATIASIANPQGRTYIAGFDMLGVGGGFDNFNPALVYAAANPIPTIGSVTISGATNSARLDAFVGGNFTSGAVSASAINARVGGLASLTGMWLSPDVHLRSNDIDIAATAGIDAGNSGDITLLSTNATQALIGDGLTGTGYALSNAEFGRLSAGSVAIAARGDASAAIDMLIGNLTITGPLAGSTIESPTGTLLFFTGNPATETPGGVIRITGNVAATGFQPTNVLEFVTGRFELDADTGSVLVEQSAGVLGGILDITADRIHVASGVVLQRLIDNPLYAGREDDLAAPIAVARPNGVIAADTIYVSPTQAVLVQNTGTSALRAGFRAGYAELFPPQGAPPGSIELIVNGQLVTPDGTLTGVAVRDALIDVLDIEVYTANSSINGCPLTGSCGGSIFPPGFTPIPGIQQEITLINRNLLPPPSFGNEDFIDDNDQATEDGATSPIQPPLPLFDTSELNAAAGGTSELDAAAGGTSGLDPAAGGAGGLDAAAGGADAIIGTPMRSSPGLEDKDDVDDPISGSGNPALMDVVPPVANQEKQP